MHHVTRLHFFSIGAQYSVLVRRCISILCLLVVASTVQAQVVINEIHYNPPDSFDVQNLDVEFLEIYNTTAAPIDLSSASFTGIDYTFPGGSVIQANEYLVLVPVSTDAELVWNITPFGVFSGGLSGGGETIQLLASDGLTIIDTVTYDDNAPWPGAPDGNGPSLELINPALDNSVAESWLASTQATPTPGAQNSVFSTIDSPSLNNALVVPELPLSDSDFTVQVDAPNADSPQFYYRLNMEGEVGPLPLSILSGDTWFGTIPAQADGTLVRFRFVSDTAQSPAAADTRNYHGVVVTDADLATTQLPVFQFYISDADYANLYDTPYDDDEFPVVVAYGSQVVDNARIRIRGGSSRKRLKKNFKIELPDGYSFNLGLNSPYPLDEFAWQADRGDVPFNATLFAWDALAEEGEPDIANFHIRLEKNGDFYGLYRLQEVYDGTYRNEHGKDDGQLFKATSGGFKRPSNSSAFNKKNPDDGDYTQLTEATNAVNNFELDGLKSWVYDNVDIPAMINYTSLTSLLRHGDQELKNYYAYLDDRTGRWSMLFWDLDQTWLYGSAGPCPPDDMTIPDCLGNPVIDAVLGLPEFEAMHWRRTQSLVDKWLYLYDLEARRENIIGRISVEEAELDLQLWGAEGRHWDSNLRLDPYYKDRWELQSLQRRRATFAAESRLPPLLGNLSAVVINEIHYKPGDPNEAEFIELFNPNGVAIDLSGWSIEDGISLNIRYGTVIPANGFVVFTDEDAIFRTEYSGDIFVGGQYSGGLKSGGERVALLDNAGILVDEVEYNNNALWPMIADGGGPSLALASHLLDNSLADSWVASSQFGGSPGQANSVIAAAPVLTLSNQSVVEGSSDTSVGVTFALDSPALAATVFSYTAIDGSAQAGIDYQSSSDTLQFPVGSTELTIQVIISGDDTFTGNRAFSFSVVAVSDGLVGEIGDVLIIDDEAPPDETAPGWENGLIATLGVTDQSLEVQWSGASDAQGVTGYLVYLTGPNQTTDQFSTSTSSITLDGLNASTSYSIRVEAVDAAANESSDGPVAQLSTNSAPDTTLPNWVTPSLVISNPTNIGFNLSWQGANDNVGVVGYLLTVELVDGDIDTLNETDTSTTLTGLLASSEYRLEVQAVDAAGNQSTDGPVGFATTSDNPLGLVVELDGLAHTVALMSASGQDRGPGETTLLSAGQQIEFQGNLWKRVEINYEVKSDTILEFDFYGGSQGEVHAIGLETNAVVSSNLTYQLWGTQRFGKNDYNNYDQSVGQTVRYRIPIGELVRNRTYPYLTLISDQDKAPFTNMSRFSNIALLSESDLEVDEVAPTWPNPVLTLDDIGSSSTQVSWPSAVDESGISEYEILVDDQVVGTSPNNSYTVTNLVPQTSYSIRVEAVDLSGNRSIDGPQLDIQTLEAPPGLQVSIDGMQTTFDVLSYGTQDRIGGYTLEQAGAAIHLDGNTWKYIQTDLVITSDTVVSFDFSSVSEGGLHGIALENNLSPSSSKTFKTYGSKRFGHRDFETYNNGDGTVRISIPVGQYLSGNHPYLVFVNDHDVSAPNAQSVYSNIVIESGADSS